MDQVLIYLLNYGLTAASLPRISSFLFPSLPLPALPLPSLRFSLFSFRFFSQSRAIELDDTRLRQLVLFSLSRTQHTGSERIGTLIEKRPENQRRKLLFWDSGKRPPSAAE